MWKPSVVNGFGQKLFVLAYPNRKWQFYEIGNQTGIILILQMLLYFNVWLFLVWILVIITSLDAKYHTMTDTYKILSVAVFLVLSIAESLRLYLAYVGNLAAKIPELATFWLISTLIQFPLEMFLLFDGGTMPRLEERFINCLMTLLLVAEIAAGTIALKDLAERRAKAFYLARLYGVEDIKVENLT